MFTTSNNSFGPTEISYLENRFCGMALNAKRYNIKNGNEPTQGSITEGKESELEEFVDFARLIMGVLGHKVFEPLVKDTAAPEESEPVKETPLLHFETKKVQATGRVVADGFVVIKGSRLNPIISKSCLSNVVEFRQKFSSRIIDNMLAEDVLQPNGASFPKTAFTDYGVPTMGGALRSNEPSGSTTYRKTDKTNKNRLHWA